MTADGQEPERVRPEGTAPVSAWGAPESIHTLLDAADEILALAKHAQAAGDNHAALCLALYGNEYVRAARAMQEMNEAFAALHQSANTAYQSEPGVVKRTV